MYVERYGTGTGETFFGLHGWSGDHRTFAPLTVHLPPEASLYSADLPGYGQSPAPRAWTLEAIADEIAEALKEIDANRITLIGNCSGALFGLLAALKGQERVGRMILIDPFAYWPWYFRVFVNPAFGRRAYNTTFANPVGRWLTNQSLRRRRTDATDLTVSFGAIDHDVTYRHLALLAGIDGIEQFRELKMPVEIVYGERTFGAVKESVRRWQSIWPQAQATELAGAGHLPILEATPQLARIVFAPVDAAAQAGRRVEAGNTPEIKASMEAESEAEIDSVIASEREREAHHA